jgi:hypothetical protein
MPSFVPPETSTFAVEAGKARSALVGFSVTNRQGWSVVPRATLIVFDGPDEEGFLLPRLDEHGIDRAPPEWDAAVERHRGAWLVVDGDEDIFAALAG